MHQKMNDESRAWPKLWPAPAKLNLFLHITGRRRDGYHQLQSVFQLIALCDFLEFKVRQDGRLERIDPIEGVEPSTDLAIRAARLLQKYTGTSLGADIAIEKRIPMGAGLGGGSSDAATALVALNLLWGLGLSVRQLADLGVELGADVPVFVHGRNAWAEGIGDILTPIELPRAWYAIFVPPVHVSTAEIYTSEDLTRDSIPIRISRFLQGYTVNTLEPVVFAKYAAVKGIAEWLKEADYEARMSGSGGAVFAVCLNQGDAQALVKQCSHDCQRFVVEGYCESPLKKLRGDTG